MDLDYVAVDVNRIHLYFLTQAPTYEEFRKLWDRKNRQTSYKLLEQRFSGDERDWGRIRRAWKVAHRGWNDVPERLRELRYMIRNFQLSTFANNPEDYAYVRTMALEGRIIAVPGDLNGAVTMKGIASRARQMEIPIRVVYMSNAEEYMRFPPNMRENIRALPVDQRSIVIRTATTGAKYVLGYPDGEKFPDKFPFHYNVQPVLVFQEWMNYSEKFKLLDMLRHNRKLQKGLSIQEKTPADLGLSVRAAGVQ